MDASPSHVGIVIENNVASYLVLLKPHPDIGSAVPVFRNWSNSDDPFRVDEEEILLDLLVPAEPPYATHHDLEIREMLENVEEVRDSHRVELPFSEAICSYVLSIFPPSVVVDSRRGAVKHPVYIEKQNI